MGPRLQTQKRLSTGVEHRLRLGPADVDLLLDIVGKDTAKHFRALEERGLLDARLRLLERLLKPQRGRPLRPVSRQRPRTAEDFKRWMAERRREPTAAELHEAQRTRADLRAALGPERR